MLTTKVFFLIIWWKGVIYLLKEVDPKIICKICASFCLTLLRATHKAKGEKGSPTVAPQHVTIYFVKEVVVTL